MGASTGMCCVLHPACTATVCTTSCMSGLWGARTVCWIGRTWHQPLRLLHILNHAKNQPAVCACTVPCPPSPSFTCLDLQHPSPKLLMIPRPRAGQTLPDVLNNRTAWMLVDRSLISFDGTQCDRVGTSFTAFKYHTDRCKRAPQVSQLGGLDTPRCAWWFPSWAATGVTSWWQPAAIQP